MDRGSGHGGTGKRGAMGIISISRRLSKSTLRGVYALGALLSPMPFTRDPIMILPDPSSE